MSADAAEPQPPRSRLAQLKLADLPEKTLTFWRLAGPGAVLVGLSIGAGEIVVWPRIVAQYGGSMIWAAVLGVFVQLWVNIEAGRYPLRPARAPTRASVGCGGASPTSSSRSTWRHGCFPAGRVAPAAL